MTSYILVAWITHLLLFNHILAAIAKLPGKLCAKRYCDRLTGNGISLAIGLTPLAYWKNQTRDVFLI
jgi:hypothetical protein